MNEFASVKDQLLATWNNLVQGVVDSLPLVLTGVILLVFAFVVAKIVERVLRAILIRTKFDGLLQKVGIDKTLQKMGIRQSLNHFLPRVVYFLLLFMFLQSAVDALGLTIISSAMSAFFAYLPNLIAALLLLFLGTSAAQFAGGAVRRAAEDAAIDYAASLGTVVSSLILFIVGIMAFGQLKLDTDIVRIVTICLLCGVGLAFGLSFGLGSRDVTRNILAGFYAKRLFNAGDEIEIRGERGRLRAITPTQAVIEKEGEFITVANGVFLDEVVRGRAES